jgi:cell division protein FtsL
MRKTAVREEQKGWAWWMVLSGFSIVSLLVLVFLGQYAVLIRDHYQIVALKDRQRTLQRERATMLLELQSLSSLERVESVAIKRLGMVVPAHRQVLDLRKIQLPEQGNGSPSAKN